MPIRRPDRHLRDRLANAAPVVASSRFGTCCTASPRTLSRCDRRGQLPLFSDVTSELFVPEELQPQPAVGVQICYVGDIEAGTKLVAPLTAAFPPAVDLVAPVPCTCTRS
jgi:hypothetical protein